MRELVSEVQEGAQRLYSWGTHGRQNDSGFVCLFRLQSVFGLCFSSVLSCTCITIIVVGQVSFCFLKSDDSKVIKLQQLLLVRRPLRAWPCMGVDAQGVPKTVQCELCF